MCSCWFYPEVLQMKDLFGNEIEELFSIRFDIKFSERHMEPKSLVLQVFNILLDISFRK